MLARPPVPSTAWPALFACMLAAAEPVRAQPDPALLDVRRLLAEAQLAAEHDPGQALSVALAAARRVAAQSDLSAVQPRVHHALLRIADALHEVAVLGRHEGGATCVAFAADGACASGGEDGVVNLFGADGAPVWTLEPGGRLQHLAFGRAGSRLLTQSADGWTGAQLWDVQASRRLATLVGGGRPVFSIDGQWVAAPLRGGGVGVWSAADGSEHEEIDGHAGPVHGVCFAPDGMRLLSYSADRTARLTDVDGRLVHELVGHERGITAAVFSADGTWLATGAEDGEILVWSVRDGDRLLQLRASAPVQQLEFARDRRRLLVGVRGQFGRVYTLQSTTEPDRVVRLGSALSASLAPQEPIVALARADGEVELVDFDGARRAVLLGHRGYASGLAWFIGGERLASAGRDGTVRSWRRHPGKALRTHSLVPSGLTPAVVVAVDESTGRVAAVDGDGQLHTALQSAHGFDSWRVLASDGDAAPPTAVGVATDGSGRVVVGDERGGAAVWSGLRGSPRRIALTGAHRVAIGVAAFSAAGDRVVTGSLDGVLCVWDPATGARVAHWRAPGGVVDAAFHPSGSSVLVTTAGADAYLFGASDGERLASYRGHRERLTVGMFIDAGTRVAIASLDGGVRLYEAATGGMPVLELDLGGAAVALAASGGVIAAGSIRGDVAVWDSKTGEERCRLASATRQSVNALALLDDGSTVLCGAADGVVRVVSVGAGLEIIRTDVGFELASAAVDPARRTVVTATSDGELAWWPLDAVAFSQRLRPRALLPEEERAFLLR